MANDEEKLAQLKAEEERARAEALKKANEDREAGQSSGHGLFYRPSVKELTEINLDLDTITVASNEKIEKIAANFRSLGVADADLGKAAWDMAIYCRDNGSSAQTELVGKSPAATEVTRASLGAAIKEICTLRQFCMFYAKVVFNYSIIHNQPPANWQKRGFNYSERFAAFDFFDGVTHHASLEPKGGLIRRPTAQEMIANSTSKEVMVYRQVSKEGTQAINVGEITGGVKHPKVKIGIKNSNVGK